MNSLLLNTFPLVGMVVIQLVTPLPLIKLRHMLSSGSGCKLTQAFVGDNRERKFWVLPCLSEPRKELQVGRNFHDSIIYNNLHTRVYNLTPSMVTMLLPGTLNAEKWEWHRYMCKSAEREAKLLSPQMKLQVVFKDTLWWLVQISNLPLSQSSWGKSHSMKNVSPYDWD